MLDENILVWECKSSYRLSNRVLQTVDYNFCKPLLLIKDRFKNITKIIIAGNFIFNKGVRDAFATITRSPEIADHYARARAIYQILTIASIDLEFSVNKLEPCRSSRGRTR